MTFMILRLFCHPGGQTFISPEMRGIPTVNSNSKCTTNSTVKGVGFSVGVPLPGGAQLATLTGHALKNGLHSFDKKGIVKKHVKRDAGGVWSCIEGVLGQE